MTQAHMFCPSAVDVGIFIRTAITYSRTGGIMVGAEGGMRVGMVSGGLEGGGGVEASGAVGGWRGGH